MSDDEKRDSLHKDLAEILKVTEIHKTIRTVIICACVIISTYFVCETIVKAMNAAVEVSKWATVAITVLCSGIYSILFWIYDRRYKKYTKVDHQRLRELESSVDPKRLSSGLEADGSSPPEDLT